LNISNCFQFTTILKMANIYIYISHVLTFCNLILRKKCHTLDTCW